MLRKTHPKNDRKIPLSHLALQRLQTMGLKQGGWGEVRRPSQSSQELVVGVKDEDITITFSGGFPGDIPRNWESSGFLPISQENRKSRDTARGCAKAFINVTASQADTMRRQRVLKPSVSLGHHRCSP